MYSNHEPIVYAFWSLLFAVRCHFVEFENFASSIVQAADVQ